MLLLASRSTTCFAQECSTDHEIGRIIHQNTRIQFLNSLGLPIGTKQCLSGQVIFHIYIKVSRQVHEAKDEHGKMKHQTLK